MEQEPSSELPQTVLKRVAFTLRLSAHMAFIILSLLLAGIALASFLYR